MDLTPEFVRRIPKTDLHLHLDGSLRLRTLIEMARAERVELPSYDEAGLRETVFKPSYANLGEYLRCFAYTTAVLQNPENLERAAYELARDNIEEGVRYIEVRFAPQLHVRSADAIRESVAAVARGLERAASDHNASALVKTGEDLEFVYGMIMCAMRAFTEKSGPYFAGLLGALHHAPRAEVQSVASLELARIAVQLRDEGLPVVGFDLAGEEAGYPAGYHVDAYSYAHSHFLKATVHAGEAYGPESIFQAITECHANRIGHGTFLFEADMIQDASIADPGRYVEQLAEYIASQRIAIEVCLSSNLQTIPELKSVTDHPLGQMLKHNLSVSICTDNRLVSNTTVCRELERVVESLDITPGQFRNIIVAGFKGSFFPGSYNRKRGYVHRAMDLYDRCAG